jgi:hypothetical protein
MKHCLLCNAELRYPIDYTHWLFMPAGLREVCGACMREPYPVNPVPRRCVKLS